jgi:hypothetical protein
VDSNAHEADCRCEQERRNGKMLKRRDCVSPGVQPFSLQASESTVGSFLLLSMLPEQDASARRSLARLLESLPLALLQDNLLRASLSPSLCLSTRRDPSSLVLCASSLDWSVLKRMRNHALCSEPDEATFYSAFLIVQRPVRAST